MLSRLRPIASRAYFIPRSISSSGPENDVLLTECDKRAVLTLNRPKQLNALNHRIVHFIYPKLREWKNSKDLIIIKGSKVAFSAGGDATGLASAIQNGEIDYVREEYCNLYHIVGMLTSLKTPYLSVMHGITVGGGASLSIPAKYRLATETSLFAVPEAQIGLLPDVGISYYLSRMPKNIGMFLALTGYRLKGYDLCHVGAASHFCHSSLLAELETEVIKPDTKVDAVLRAFHSASIDKLPCKTDTPFSLAEHSTTIDECFSKQSVEEIVDSLKKIDNAFTTEVLKLIKIMSPISLKVIYEQMRRAANLDVFEVLNMDYRLGWRMFAGEYCEGVRALLVDKDKKPKWQHKSIVDVTDSEVADYFKPLDEANELNLPESFVNKRL